MAHLGMTRKAQIEDTGRACGWQKRLAAATLGISRPTLDRWIAQYGVAWGNGHGLGNGIHEGNAGKVKNERKGVSQFGVVGLREAPTPPILKSMDAPAINELRVATNVRLRGALWKEARKAAIDRGCPAWLILEEALERYLKPATKPKAKEPAE